MWYKEWRLVHYKLWLWLGGFGLITLNYLLQNVFLKPFEMLVYPDGGVETHTSLFENWILIAQGFLPIFAVLGGIDLISEEVGRGTISFLLAKPLSRSRLYLTKIGVNSLVLGGVIGLLSLIMLLIDQLPRSVGVSRWNVTKEGTAVYAGFLRLRPLEPSQPVEIFPALLSIALIILECFVITAMVGLVSIFTRNLLQTLAVSALPLGALLFVLDQVGKTYNSATKMSPESGMAFSPVGEIPLVSGVVEGRWVGVGLLAALAALLISLGLFFFRYKKF